MRYAICLLSVITAACSAAPGAPLTDITATTTERPGAMRSCSGASRASAIRSVSTRCAPSARRPLRTNWSAQLLPHSPDEVVVEVRPHQSAAGETTTDSLGARPRRAGGSGPPAARWHGFWRPHRQPARPGSRAPITTTEGRGAHPPALKYRLHIARAPAPRRMGPTRTDARELVEPGFVRRTIRAGTAARRRER